MELDALLEHQFRGHAATGTATGFGYDGAQRLSGMVQYLAGTAHDATWNYGHNPAGQIGSVSRDNVAFAWTGHYAVARAYTTDGLNRYTAAGTASFGYDQNGNLTSDGSSTYAYDVENRLVARSGGVALSYDPLGRLFQVSSGAGTTTFLYDGDALVAEYNAAGTMTRRFVHNVGADVPLLSYAGSNLSTPSYLHADERGSIVAISDASGNGAVNTYDEYGIPGAGNTGRFQYTGQIWLDEIGMYYYKARIYSPTLGRFLQTDPIGYDDQFNLYAYVGNDPVNATDPSGEAIETIWDVANVVMGVTSAVSNIRRGNYGAAAVDGVGVLIDGAATAVPFIPGGVGTAIKTARGVDRVVDAARGADRASGAGRAGRNVPNPSGSRGAPDHQADVRGPGRRQAEAQARPGEEVVTEGGLVGHPGVNRRPDNQVVDRNGRTRLVVESERRPNGAYNRRRVEEYQRCGIECQIRPLPPR